MENQDVWTSANFYVMGWHDCRLYSLTFPSQDFRLSFDIDYIFEWCDSGGFLVSPCRFIFENVAGFAANLDFGNDMLIFISEVTKSNKTMSPNGMVALWEYKIICDVGVISFTASDYEMNVLSPPVRSKTLDLGRNGTRRHGDSADS